MYLILITFYRKRKKKPNVSSHFKQHFWRDALECSYSVINSSAMSPQYVG